MSHISERAGFLGRIQKKTRNKKLCCLRSFLAGNGFQKVVLVRASKRTPDFGFLRRKYKLTQSRSQTGAQTGELFLGSFFSTSRSHIYLHTWSCVKQNLARSVSASLNCRKWNARQHVNVLAIEAFFPGVDFQSLFDAPESRWKLEIFCWFLSEL